MNVDITATCNGHSYWSFEPERTVRIHQLTVPYINRNATFGELCAYFVKDDWDCVEHGLIYTDKGWMEEFRTELLRIGFTKEAAMDVVYSEQGMQSAEYVSMDVGKTFLKEFKELSTRAG